MPQEQISPVSIVIPTLNEEHYLPILLESLLKIGEQMDIIVVDGNSADKTVVVANSFAPRFHSPSSLRVISSARGLSVQRNLGARIAKNELLLFLDADVVIPSQEKYRKLVSSFVGLKLAAGVAHITPIENIWRAHFVYWFFDLSQRVLLVFKKPCLGTFCLMTRKGVFNTIGGFDEAKRVTEDIDFCFRAAAEGPVKHLPIYIPVSARRFIKYGYWRVFWLYFKEGFIYAVTGKARLHKITETNYPFGEYTPEHVKLEIYE